MNKEFGFSENKAAENTQPQAKTADAPVYGVIANCKLVNVRKAADTNSEVVTKLTQGTKVKITGEETKGFYPVQYRNTTSGFIMSKFIQKASK